MKTTRLEAFSDGIFAFAITLLVLAIELPDAGHRPHLAHDLLQLWPSYLAYALSVFVIGAIWINHHGMFQHIDRVDNSFLLLNLLQLMTITFIPFPTAVLASTIAQGSGMPVAAAFYGLTLTIVGILVNAMWWYAVRADLVKQEIGEAKTRLLTRRFAIGPIAYALATAVGLVLPWLALAVFAGLNLFYLWPRWKAKRGAPAPE
jgi:uncharacterized membrane protein